METVKEKLAKLLTESRLKPVRLEGKKLIRPASSVEIATHLIQNGVTIQEWVSVDERLPEFVKVEKYGDLGNVAKSVQVLCSCLQKDGKPMVKEGYCQRWLDGSGAVWWKIPGTIDKVTHWMPLPEPPKGV